MNIYSRKQKWKFILFVIAFLIGIASLTYTNILVGKLAEEERKSVELWAKANRELSKSDLEDDVSFIYEVIIRNKTIPVILTDENYNILNSRNLDEEKSLLDSTITGAKVYQTNLRYLEEQLAVMRSSNEPIEISWLDGNRNYIFYKDSILLQKLMYYPFIQLGVIFLFILVSYYAFSSSRKAEQNQVWLGMSKETAHQLGTPISSLIAWVEYLKLKDTNPDIIQEMQKDVSRLEMITERFSKIGSSPVLSNHNIYTILYDSIKYLKTRTSYEVEYRFSWDSQDETIVPLNAALFEWVIENICKNAVDAMDGKGSITIHVLNQMQFIYIDITDTGKGIAKSKFKTIFQPGYTTKSRGWGLGLSLSKRIIENYHDGKIFVKESHPDKGSTIRIVLKKGNGTTLSA
ncbi:MAG: HAMP domain-containing histidine kinase [Bacteroidales bacterium]|nr:HAMP domain-containing histidine kinase [Bacteroidales bacterium]